MRSLVRVDQSILQLAGERHLAVGESFISITCYASCLGGELWGGGGCNYFAAFSLAISTHFAECVCYILVDFYENLLRLTVPSHDSIIEKSDMEVYRASK
jgi:hypothetical protein